MRATLRVRFGLHKGWAAQKGIRDLRFTREDTTCRPRGAARLQEYDAGDGSTCRLDLSAVVTCAREHAATER
jgi:hypothetical protein